MPISEEGFQKLSDFPSEGHKEAATILSEIKDKLTILGKRLDYDVGKYIDNQIGFEIDLSWFNTLTSNDFFAHKHVIVFEIEVRKKNRKYIKGDILNIKMSRAPIGIIVLSERGMKEKFEGLYRSANKFIKNSEFLKVGSQKIFVWSEKDVDEFLDDEEKLKQFCEKNI